MAALAVALGVHAFTKALRAQATPPATVQTRAASEAAGRARQGKIVFEAHCVECHGDTGRGDGPAAAFLTPWPRDFSTGKFKIRTTETGSVPTGDDLTRTVREGLNGSAMSGWNGVLSDTDVRDVVEYVKTLSPQFASPPKPVAIGPGVPQSPESTARGQRVYEKLQCGKCHGTDGRGAGAVATDFEDDWKQPLHAADLTEPWTFRGGATPRDVYLRFRTGMMGTPMPSFADTASDAEMWDLANYVVSLGRAPVWSMSATDIARLYARQEAEALRDPVRRGKYVADTRGCALCHSPIDDRRRMLPGLYMAGGQVIRIQPFGDFPTANLTSDMDAGIGNATDEQLRQAITRGVKRDGTRMLPFPMDWGAFSAMTPDDLNALIAYLRTIPPVSNRIPPPTSPFLASYLWGKFRMLVLKQDLPLVIFPGNAGSMGVR
ncbi:MAG: c-type cytochrome [Vicinamibacterales bacterium]